MWQQIGNKFVPPHRPTIQFLLVALIFWVIDKINNFWQQKQQVLFLSNMTPKVCMTTSWVSRGALFFQKSRVLSEGTFSKNCFSRHFEVKSNFFWKSSHVDLGTNLITQAHFSASTSRWVFSESTWRIGEKIEKSYDKQLPHDIDGDMKES